MNALQEKERELQQQLLQVRDLSPVAADNCLTSIVQARAALESMDIKSLSEAQSLHSFEAKELERCEGLWELSTMRTSVVGRGFGIVLYGPWICNSFRIRLKAELEQRERRLKEQVSTLSEKLSRGETGPKDALARRNADKGTVLQPPTAEFKHN